MTDVVLWLANAHVLQWLSHQKQQREASDVIASASPRSEQASERKARCAAADLQGRAPAMSLGFGDRGFGWPADRLLKAYASNRRTSVQGQAGKASHGAQTMTIYDYRELDGRQEALATHSGATIRIVVGYDVVVDRYRSHVYLEKDGKAIVYHPHATYADEKSAVEALDAWACHTIDDTRSIWI